MSNPSITVRPAELTDLSDLLALYRTLNGDDEPLDAQHAGEVYGAILSHPGLQVFLALDGALPVATASLLITPNLTRGGRPYAIIENVVSARSHRGKGYGRAVVHHAIEAARQAGCYKTMLLTGRSDPAVHRFYETCGFVQSKTGFQIRH
ncbi:GNAT family N-acetyltransferase [Rhizobium sp. SL42]|uniref:GNAT family N-acetyltransferase n=1 Tax=Rhizobium sp. SL42 TaxID=2806346 RepID=UPI001F295205|nr:GNAT family N-acetyltransferase [Rhizobium sp. SL42]UJW74296.1 GNAT family N-acetyltransferase [Rhizobium sp. SL42]